MKFLWTKEKMKTLSANERKAREKLLTALSDDLLGQIRGGAAAVKGACHTATGKVT